MPGTRSSTRRLQASRPGTIFTPGNPTVAQDPALQQETGHDRTGNARPIHERTIRERTTKRRGELAELAFTLKATSLGFAVSKPYGDSERYDFIVDAPDHDPDPDDDESSDPLTAPDHLPIVIPTEASGRAQRTHSRSGGTCYFAETTTTPARLYRVQVKCSTQLLNGLYRINAHRRVHGRAVPYRAHEIDFIAAYIIPEDTWYIIPLAATRNRTSLLFRRKQDPKPGLYDAYKEAWHLLKS